MGAAAVRALERSGLVYAAALAVVLTGTLFLLERRLDFFLAEEGFLWYGVIQTAHGGVPLRDFFSYDPGRYIWGAAWAQLFGDGILALRLSTAIFQALGLFCGLLAARRALPARGWRWRLALVGLLLLAWMVPRNKLFEPALLMMALLAAVLLVEQPTLRRHLAAGALVGVGLFCGKNHGLYLGLALGLLVLLVYGKGESAEPGELGRRLGAWLGGIAAGAAPLVAMLLFVPGFARAYWSSVRFFLVQGRTNFPLPIPWPWLAWQEGPDLADRATALGLGLGFLLMPLVCGAAALLALTARRGELPRRALLAACGFVGLVYMHHAFSRADFYHLAPAIPPLLLGLLALVAAAPARYRWAAWLAVVPVLAFTTFFVVVRDRPLYEYLVDRGTAEAFVRFDAAGDRLWVDPSKAALLYGIESEVARLVPPGEPILIVPDKAGLYPLLHRESPVWDIYPIWPDRDGRLDAQMLRQMRAKDVRWVLVRDYALDRHRELRFSNTHPHVWEYLMGNFEKVPLRGLPKRLYLLHRRE